MEHDLCQAPSLSAGHAAVEERCHGALCGARLAKGSFRLKNTQLVIKQNEKAAKKISFFKSFIFLLSVSEESGTLGAAVHL